ncbi:MAG: hypothetical protein ACK5L8_11875 [Marinicella pacifica]
MRKLIDLFLCMAALVAFQQARAISLSDTNQGQALIFPYYSVQNDLRNLLTIENNTNQYKAISIEFREGFNGQPVLPLNLYLSPLESWTGQLISGLSSLPPPYTGQSSTRLVSFNQGCTPWLGNPQDFLPYELDNDPAVNDLVRSQTGFIQVYEMGEVVGDHANAIDNDCDFIKNSFQNGQWSYDAAVDIQPATGGISGSMTIKNMIGGHQFDYQAIAIEDFHNDGQFFHAPPGNYLLLEANTLQNQLILDNQAQEHTWITVYEAASASFMRTLLSGQFLNNQTTATEVVLTFPTKNKYVNLNYPQYFTPFTQQFLSNGACEVVPVNSFDDNGVLEPLVNPQSVSLCRSVNVLGFNNPTYSPVPFLIDQHHDVVDTENELGTVEFDFSLFNTSTGRDSHNNNERYVYYGLPVIGVVMHKVEAGGNTSLTMQEMTHQQRIVTDLIYEHGFAQ